MLRLFSKTLHHRISVQQSTVNLVRPFAVSFQKLQSNPGAGSPGNPGAGSPGNPGAKSFKPDNLEKRFLVWTGKYKSLEEVPNYVSNEEMERARNRIRIKVANIMILATIVGCIIMVISGKRAAERGESVTKQNIDWHQKYNEQKAAEGK